MALNTAPLLTCPDLGLTRLHTGKVREMFALPEGPGGEERLLLVATDRLSAFDVVFPDGIPGKGEVLTRLSTLWFQATQNIVRNHLLSTDVTALGLSAAATAALQDRSMIVRKTKRIDVECVVRGYLAGSGWKEYQKDGTVTGIQLPAGLQLSSRLPEPIFTPALKNDVGHDENVSFERMVEAVGRNTAEWLRQTSIALYNFAAEKALKAGIILADTKFEFGMIGDEIILIDEIFTPDSSRYWPQDAYAPGKAIDSLDKQPIRDWAEQTGWNKQPPAPSLPEALIAEASRRYWDAYDRLRAVLA